MRRSLQFLVLLLTSIPMTISAQAVQSADSPVIHVKAGAGLDYWATNYSGRWKFGPAAWVGTEFWHGLGIQVEGHSLIMGGSLPAYKYFTGEGGLVYTSHHWARVEPFAKAELGFAGLSYPRPRSTSHDTRAVWALGGGLEYQTANRLWTRFDYTYEGFPQFLSYVTLKKHTLNPNGVTVGISYHIR